MLIMARPLLAHSARAAALAGGGSGRNAPAARPLGRHRIDARLHVSQKQESEISLAE
jgi:hypothetical protein